MGNTDIFLEANYFCLLCSRFLISHSIYLPRLIVYRLWEQMVFPCFIPCCINLAAICIMWSCEWVESIKDVKIVPLWNLELLNTYQQVVTQFLQILWGASSTRALMPLSISISTKVEFLKLQFYSLRPTDPLCIHVLLHIQLENARHCRTSLTEYTRRTWSSYMHLTVIRMWLNLRPQKIT